MVLFYHLNPPRKAMKAQFSGKKALINAHTFHDAGEHDIYYDIPFAI